MYQAVNNRAKFEAFRNECFSPSCPTDKQIHRKVNKI